MPALISYCAASTIQARRIATQVHHYITARSRVSEGAGTSVAWTPAYIRTNSPIQAGGRVAVVRFSLTPVAKVTLRACAIVTQGAVRGSRGRRRYDRRLSAWDAIRAHAPVLARRLHRALIDVLRAKMSSPSRAASAVEHLHWAQTLDK